MTAPTPTSTRNDELAAVPASTRDADGVPPRTTDAPTLHDEVRSHYAAAALTVLDGRPAETAEAAGCCGGGCGCGPTTDAGTDFGSVLYPAADRESLPDAAVLASLGCGNPLAVAELREGETVLDLGSGGGIDVLLSAGRVGPTGHAYGVDMTPEMLALARSNAAAAGATNVTFLEGQIEALPLPADAVDVVISNCVVNLAADKTAVFREIARVLRPGGRIGITDIVAEDRLTADERAERGSFVGCIAGALSYSEFRAGLAEVGLTDVEIVPTHAVADGLDSAIVRARKPATTAIDGGVGATASVAQA